MKAQLRTGLALLGLVVLWTWLAAARAEQEKKFTENFDGDALKGWEFSCQKEFVAEGTGKILRVSGAGHALWLVKAGDFTLKFKHRYEKDKGTGEIIFRGSGEPPDHRYTFLRVEANQLVIGTRIHAKDREIQEQALKSVAFELTPSLWHDFAIEAKQGKIDVSIDGANVLSVDDANPLPASVIGLGVIKDSGQVDYDDAELIVR